jgi:hypothetical protein
VAVLDSLLLYAFAGAVYLIFSRWMSHIRSRGGVPLDRDEWFVAGISLGGLFLTTVLLIPDADVAWSTRLDIDAVGVVIVGVFSFYYFGWLRKSGKPRPPKPITGRNWFARLAIFGRRRQEDSELFLREIAGALVGGAVAIYFAYFFWNEFLTVHTQAVEIDLGVTLTVGIFAICYGTLRGLGELGAIRLRAQTIKINRQESWEKWTEDFDDELFKFKDTQDNKTRAEAVANLSGQLEKLKTNEKGIWPESVRQAVLGLVTTIAKKLPSSDTVYRIQTSGLLRLAYTKRDPTVNAKIVEEFQETYEDLTDPELELDVNTLLLRQEMHEFSEPFMTTLVDEAIDTWSNERFARTWEQIRLDQLKARNIPDFEKLKEHLRAVWQNKKKNETARNRALRLLERAKELR